MLNFLKYQLKEWQYPARYLCQNYKDLPMVDEKLFSKLD
jgi:hypothetical protein